MPPQSSSSEATVETIYTNAQLLQRWRTCVALAFSFLGLIDSSFTAKREHLGTIIDVLLTGAQSTSLASIACAIYLIRKYKDRDVEPSKFVADIPALACYASGTLLIGAMCMARWKATCAAVGLVVLFLFAAHAAKMRALGVRAAQRCMDIKTALCVWLALLIVAAREMRAMVGALVADVEARGRDAEGGMAR